MSKKINTKEIIKENPLIKEDKFKEEHKLVQNRRKSAKPTSYNILPPFSTERRAKSSSEIGDNEKRGYIRC